MEKRRRDLKTLKVMELVVADTHTFDCFVTATDRNGKRCIVKPCLVGFMDMKSRSLVGWGICEIPNSQIIKEVLINMVMEKTNPLNPFQGVPRILLIDNGKDYTAETLTGRPRTVRVELDDDTVYAKREHSGLRSQKEYFKTPYDVYCNEDRYYKAAPPKGYLEQMAMVRVERKIYATGISLFDCNYMHEDLQPYINSSKKFIVRYDANNVGTIDVYDPDTERFICKAENMRLLNPLAEVTDTELENHIRNQKRQTKNARSVINYAQMTYEERIDMADIELKKKALVLPETVAESEQKVVSMPRNTNYLKDKKAVEAVKKERQPMRPHMQKYLDQVIAEMKIAGGR